MSDSFLVKFVCYMFYFVPTLCTHFKQLPVQVTKHGGDTVVELTPIQMFARNVYLLLFESEGRLPLSAFESAYLDMFGIACEPTQFGHSNIISLLQSIPDTVLLRGRANKKTLVLSKDLACKCLIICVYLLR
jgi:hypothetical protein